MIFIESNAPRTMMIMGALMSGGDFIGLARELVKTETKEAGVPKCLEHVELVDENS